jgi:hypothetical protein
VEVEIARLRKANDILSARKKRKKKAIRGSNSRSVADGIRLIDRRVEGAQNAAASAVVSQAIELRLVRCLY